MKKNIRVSEPSPEMLEKIVRARTAIASQKERNLKCPLLPSQRNNGLRGHKRARRSKVQKMWSCDGVQCFKHETPATSLREITSFQLNIHS